MGYNSENKSQASKIKKISPHTLLEAALSERENAYTNDAFWLVKSRDAHRLEGIHRSRKTMGLSAWLLFIDSISCGWWGLCGSGTESLFQCRYRLELMLVWSCWAVPSYATFSPLPASSAPIQARKDPSALPVYRHNYIKLTSLKLLVDQNFDDNSLWRN